MFVLLMSLYCILPGFKSETQLSRKTHLTIVDGFMCPVFMTNTVMCSHTVSVRRSCQCKGEEK